MNRALSVMLAVLALGGCAPFKTQRSEQRSFDVTPGTVVEVRASNVSVTVDRGEAGKVSLHATKRTHAYFRSARLQKNIHLKVVQRPGRLIVSEQHPDEPKRYKVSLQLTVPPDSPLRLQLSAGSATLSKLARPVTVEIRGSGRIVSHDVTATQQLRLGRGDIEVQHPRAPFRLRTSQGNLHIRLKDGVAVNGRSVAETAQGDIKLVASTQPPLSLDVVAPPNRIDSVLVLRTLAGRKTTGPRGPQHLSLSAKKGKVTILGPPPPPPGP